MSFGMRDSARFSGGSITHRLTALFALSALVLLVPSAALLHSRLASTLHDEDARFLQETVAALRAGLLASESPMELLEREMIHEPSNTRLEPYYLRYVKDDSVVIQTPGMAQVAPAALFDPALRGDLVTPVRWRGPDGRTYLLHAAVVAARRHGAHEVLEGVIDVTHDETILRGYRQTLTFILGAGWLLVTFAGFLTARRGLRPIARLSREVRQVSARRLDRRIGDTTWPVELAELARVSASTRGPLEGSSYRLSRFSADLAHELRTPLTNLRSEAEVALNRGRTAEEYQDLIGSALEELDRLTELVDRLLFLARAEEGSGALSPSALSGRAEAKRVLDLYAPIAAEHGVTLGVEGEVTVCADPHLLSVALSNLVSNAVAHTPPGGRVTVDLHEAEGGAASIEVTDTGIGIPTEHLPHLVDRFYRVDQPRFDGAKGAGLGLSLVASIVELHRGTLGFESEVGRGTTVRLVLPARLVT